MSKLWAGRTSGVTDKVADDFNSSIHFDHRMYQEDIKGSMAHAMMLGAQGIILKEEADTLIQGLEGILADLNSGALPFDFSCGFFHGYSCTIPHIFVTAGYFIKKCWQNKWKGYIISLTLYH